MTLLRHSNVRSDEQKKLMLEAQEKDICPFCPEGIIKIHKQLVEKETKNYIITKSAFPYKGTKNHLLIIPRNHSAIITEEGWQEVFVLYSWAILKYQIDGGTLMMRFGSMAKNGSSIEHIHLHIIQGESSDEDTDVEGIKVKVGYKKLLVV